MNVQKLCFLLAVGYLCRDSSYIPYPNQDTPAEASIRAVNLADAFYEQYRAMMDGLTSEKDLVQVAFEFTGRFGTKDESLYPVDKAISAPSYIIDALNSYFATL